MEVSSTWVRIGDGRDAQLLGAAQLQVEREVHFAIQSGRAPQRDAQVGLPGQAGVGALQHGLRCAVDRHGRRADDAAHIRNREREVGLAPDDLALGLGLRRHHRTTHVRRKLVHGHLVEPMAPLARHQFAAHVERLREARRGKRFRVLYSLLRALGPVLRLKRGLGVGPDQHRSDKRLRPCVACLDALARVVPVALPLGDGAVDQEQRDQDDARHARDCEQLQSESHRVSFTFSTLPVQSH